MPKSAKARARSFKLGSVQLAGRKNGRGSGGERTDLGKRRQKGGAKGGSREGGGAGERRKGARKRWVGGK